MTLRSKYQARPTTYRGVAMRSRLEARFAAGLDTVGISWEYEPGAFADGHAQYLPDFVLHGAIRPVYVEVKPTIAMAVAALPKGDIIFASEPAASFAVACPALAEFVLMRHGASDEGGVGCWALFHWPEGTHTPDLVPLDRCRWGDIAQFRSYLADGTLMRPFDWSWR